VFFIRIIFAARRKPLRVVQDNNFRYTLRKEGGEYMKIKTHVRGGPKAR